MHSFFFCFYQYFTTAFLATALSWDEHVTLQLGEDNAYFAATLLKRPDNGLARINRGWATFVQDYGFQEGEVFIFCLVDVVGSIYMSLFRAPAS